MFSINPDPEVIIIDASFVKGCTNMVPAQKEHFQQGSGRNKGRLITKIHAAVDAFNLLQILAILLSR